MFLFIDVLDPQAMAEVEQVSATLRQSYIAAAQHFQAHDDLYLKDALIHAEQYYLYSPAFALFLSPLNYVALQDRVITRGGYVLTDPLIYIPWIMMVILIFYTGLVLKLNKISTQLH